jgi:oxygen-dependent protoporphyrinogen oxidase
VVAPPSPERGAAPLDLLVVGGGLSGLIAAWRARRAKPGARVVVLESGERPGGVVASVREEGFLVERAAASIRRGAAALHALIDELGMRGELLAASSAASNRFVLHRGRLVRVPGSPVGALTTSLVSPGAKLRLLLEPFVPRAPSGSTRETLAAFVARRFGPGLVSPLLDAVVTGIFAGDCARLEARAAFPRLVDLEESYGSIVVGAMKARRRTSRRTNEPRPPPLAALRGGTQSLVERLAQELGDVVHCNSPVTRVERSGEHWIVHTNSEASTTSQTHKELPNSSASPNAGSFTTKRLRLATPSWASAELLRPVDADLAAELAAMEAANVAVVGIGVRREQVRADVDALGFLVPKSESSPLLGVLFESSLFAGRAPPDHVLLRAMYGGERRRLGSDDDAIAKDAFAEVARVLQITGAPRLLRAFVHRPGIPQYRPGHVERLARIDARLAKLPGLELAGWSYRGIALDDRARENLTT